MVMAGMYSSKYKFPREDTILISYIVSSFEFECFRDKI